MPSEQGNLDPGFGGLDVDELARLATRLFAEQVGPLNIVPSDPGGSAGASVPARPPIDPSVSAPVDVPTSLDEGAEVGPPVGTADPTAFVPTTVVPPVRSALPTAPGAQYYFVEPSAFGVSTPSATVPAPSARATPTPPGAPGSAAALSTPAALSPSPAYYFIREADSPGARTAVPTDTGGPGSGRPPAVAGSFDPYVVRRDFPILSERVHGKPLVWLDNAATTQKPTAVIDRLVHFYEHENSNIHRGAHDLAARATDAYEAARDAVARFLHAPSSDDIVFVRGTTEGINLVAQTWGRTNIGEGDEIVVSHLEHHANIVPWQMLASEKGAKLRVIPVDDHGQILLDEYRRLLNDRTKLVAVTHVSNALGTIVPVHEVVQQAHAAGVTVLIDGAQSTPHLPVDVQALDPDFYVFSGHKVFGPTGIGALYGRRDVLDRMPPWEGGGNMIRDVTFERTEYQDPPGRFEAGTGNIADAVGLGAAIDYLLRLGMHNIAAYEHSLTEYATPLLCDIPGLRLIGTAPEKAGVLSFVLEGHSPESVGKALNQEGIAVRSGHHCAQPILRRFGLEATVRPSLAFYNTCEDVDALIGALRRIVAGSSLG